MPAHHQLSELIVEGARQNNLKNITVRLPHDAVTVITGVSGSGKSSLAFETLFAEGQWRYVESLSAYTRMFLERISRPDVDRLMNIRPAIALEQKNPVRTARSTVGTASELSDYLRLLFAKIGRPTCPDCQQDAKAYQPTSAADELINRFPEQKILILFPVETPKRSQRANLVSSLLKRGFVRVVSGDTLLNLGLDSSLNTLHQHSLQVVVDRLVIRLENRTRLVESLEMAFREGEGVAHIDVVTKGSFAFSTNLQCQGCGRTFDATRPVLFSFNHPLGACPECKGFGNILRYDENLVVPDPTKSLAEGAIEPWTKPSHHWWHQQMLRTMKRRKVDVTKPYAKLSKKESHLIWAGDSRFEGVQQFFEYLEGKRYKLHVRVFLSRYRSPVPCSGCDGTRLRASARMVKIQGCDIHEVSQWTIQTVKDWIASLALSEFETEITRDLLRVLDAKLSFLLRVGLSYLTVHRETRTLSGGEAQRIALANQLGAKLVGTLYVLDEPTIGLHPRDTAALAAILRDLAQQGNTVVTVEHDHQVIQQADHVVELGPSSGEKGGEVVCSAPYREFLQDRRSLTARYLRGDETIAIPKQRRTQQTHMITITGAREHNLKNLTIRIPLNKLVCVTGVSGSGKSTVVEHTLYAAAARAFGVESLPLGQFDTIAGLEHIRTVRLIDQEPIGRTPRSNPITYMKAYQEIRQLFAQSLEAKHRGLTASHFSFNTGEGRCRRCQGNGHEKLEMYFVEDLYVPCEDCEGRRFRPEVLHVKVRGCSIHDVLSMTIQNALAVFGESSLSLYQALQLLESLGLGYLRLGQPATSLSGGESQRLKIAAELARFSVGKNNRRKEAGVMYILDEPTTGLHTEDIKKLLQVLDRLVDAGNTVVVVEHHLEVMKCADWIIDLGPGGGDHGGYIVAEGQPEMVAKNVDSHTGRFLDSLFKGMAKL